MSDLPALSLKLDLNRLKALVDGDYITYYPSLTLLCGGYKAAAMLSVALAWTRNWLNKHPEREGWFWKTRIEWQHETGLSRCEQENARKTLVARGLLHEARRGIPARMHFRIELDRLGQLLAQSVQASLTNWDRNWDWDDPLLRQLLGRPVALYRRLAWAAGSLSGGLLLSHLVLAYRKDMSLNRPSEGWLRYFPQFIGRHCQLSRYEIDGARSRLTERGFLEARYTKTLPTNRVLRLRFDRLIAAIEACHDGVVGVAPQDHDNLPHSAIQASDKPAIQTGVFRHPESGQTGQLALDEVANRQVPNPLGYLQTLIQSARAGRFTPTIAFRIAQSRQEALARAETQRQAREIARHDHDPAARLAAREHLARMRAQLGIRSEAGR